MRECGKDLKDDDVVGAVQLNACPMGYAHTVVYMCLAKDTGEEARALNRDISVSRTSWHKGVILGRNSVFGVFRL